jgi:glycosyltransferase involved in cell wall biosynthesis
MKTVSVVIPAYNEQRYILRCIDSLLQQTYKKLEIIFIDDGSTDCTRELLKAAAKRHSHIKVFFRNHGGPGAARNYGAKKAKGDILVFVDADMVFDKNYLKTLVAPILKAKTVGTFHTKELVANKENLWARSWCINRMPEGIKESGVYRAILRKTFLDAGGFDPKKGYFDDDLGRLGSATPTGAVCYHNNPETLSEVFKHSMWVGRSLVKAPHTRMRTRLLVVLSLLLLLAALVVAVLVSWLPLLALAVIAVLSWLFISMKRTLPRLAEGHPEYIVTIPILWLFRLLGYYAGAVQQVFRNLW